MIPVDTPEIDIDQLAGAVRSGVAIVDVREPGAVLIPMAQLPQRTAELNRNAPVYVVALRATAAPP